mgnify:CR=1 FL=1
MSTNPAAYRCLQDLLLGPSVMLPPEKEYDRTTLLTYLRRNEPQFLDRLSPAEYQTLVYFTTTQRTSDAKCYIYRMYEEDQEFRRCFLGWYQTQPDWGQGRSA